MWAVKGPVWVPLLSYGAGSMAATVCGDFGVVGSEFTTPATSSVRCIWVLAAHHAGCSDANFHGYAKEVRRYTRWIAKARARNPLKGPWLAPIVEAVEPIVEKTGPRGDRSMLRCAPRPYRAFLSIVECAM
jgi:hypothetical protein